MNTTPLSRCTQQGETKNSQTRLKLKITVFNSGKARQGKARQGKARQGRAGQGRAGQGRPEHRGVISTPDEKELNRQELNTQGN